MDFINNWDPESPSSPGSSSASCVTPPAKRKKMDKPDALRNSTLYKNALDVLQGPTVDHFEIFGRSVASTMRDYPNQAAVRRFKSQILNAMSRLEAGEFDHPMNAIIINSDTVVINDDGI